jgi:hypothetical protein
MAIADAPSMVSAMPPRCALVYMLYCKLYPFPTCQLPIAVRLPWTGTVLQQKLDKGGGK